MVPDLPASNSKSTGTTPPTGHTSLKLPTVAPVSTNVKNHMSVEMTYDNYVSWKHLIIIFLRGQKALSVVDGIMSCLDSSHPQYDMWIQCNDIALSWIHATLNLSVDQTLLNYNCQLAYNAWVILEQLFQDHTSATRMHLRAQFQLFSKGNLSMDDYLQQLHSLYSIGENVKESVLVAQVLLFSRQPSMLLSLGLMQPLQDQVFPLFVRY
ncbi:hypothetical protein LIER_42007 [Lithospermum erythrorhizon]|uniref:Retrotransposon Copia-like N-terminal domain-containing protein n=1 Tax=Lithospermum erythrorhizon TaxID=34254 RepID=A0AAV3RIV8_LITER